LNLLIGNLNFLLRAVDVIVDVCVSGRTASNGGRNDSLPERVYKRPSPRGVSEYIEIPSGSVTQVILPLHEAGGVVV